MRRSFVRLVVGSVLATWALSFVVLFTYAQSTTWTIDDARKRGVVLAHELLDQTPAAERPARLQELAPNFVLPLSLLPIDEVERRLGRRPQPGEQAAYQVSTFAPREEWFFLVFTDGHGALAVGPFNPVNPTGVIPLPIILAALSLPLIGALIAIRVERGLRKVERASQELATGELGVRVDAPDGPSTELAARFNEMAERIERLIRSRDELVQAVSHELGSPLSRLRFHMELLQSGSDDGFEERCRAMTAELDALDELVAELLGYVQSEDAKLTKSEFDPARGLDDLVELAKLEATDEKRIEVQLELPTTCRVEADPRLFQRAVENVLRNAVQHANGKVRLELTENDDEVRVAVHDDGPGIPEELRAKALIPFFRVQADRNRRTGGVGLGLAIVTRIVNRHAGRIAIDRSPLGGALVTTHWPRASNAA